MESVILELIGTTTADYLNRAHRASSQGKYQAAAELQTKAEALIDLQSKISKLSIIAAIKTPATNTPAPSKAPVSSKPKITQPTRDFGSSKQWSLDGSLRPGDIDKILGSGSATKGKAFRCGDDPSKVKFSWRFAVDGKECAMWDYHGVRWSGYGPKECFDKLGIAIHGN